MSLKNPNCDGNHCTAPGEGRVLPTSDMSNLIYCRDCFNQEMIFRDQRNKSLGDYAKFSILKWSDIQAYESQTEFAQGEMREFNRVSNFLERKAKDADSVQARGHALTLRSLIAELGE